MKKEISSENIRHVPHLPGVYMFFDENANLIYVGKAKNLNRRIASYFINNEKTLKTLKLVEHVKFFDFSIVNSENDAFLLENNLIKQNKPIYNILLKDSKAYPYLILTDEAFPRLIVAERLEDVRYKYFFGPFSDRHMMYELFNMIKKLCLLRTCKFDINAEDIIKHKHKVCLEYHLGNCCGICEQHISETEYTQSISLAIDILKGNFTNVKKTLVRQMKDYSKKREYKLAQGCKEKLEMIDQYENRSIISNPDMHDCDVFYYEQSEDKTLMVYIIVRHGMIIFIKKDVL